MSNIERPWERQIGESEKAFEAFAAYRDMGEKRTYTAVADALQKSCTLIRRWSERWTWKERVRAWDNELEKEARAKAIKDRKGMIDRHVGIALQIQKKALAALMDVEPETLKPQEIREFLRFATALERDARALQADGSSPFSGSAATPENNLLQAIQQVGEIDTDDLPEVK